MTIMWKLVTVMVVLTVNDVEKETVKETIKELMDITKWIKTLNDSDDHKELEKRLTDMTHTLIDLL